MPNLSTVLNSEIRRLARKEIREQVGKTVKQVSEQRREIAALKRENAELAKRIDYLERQEVKRLADARTVESHAKGAGAPEAPAARFSPEWLAKHREKLDLSAADYSKLVGCSALSIYKWERGETSPRVAQREALASIRGIGKREAQKRLELLEA